MNIIKVGIADDHKIFRKGVILSLRQYTNISFIFEAENGEELMTRLNEEQPDVVLMDLRMPGKDGIESTKEVTDFTSVKNTSFSLTKPGIPPTLVVIIGVLVELASQIECGNPSW